MSCIATSYGVARTTVHYTVIILGLALLHIGAAMFGFVSGDFAGRWYLQHKLHRDDVEEYRRPFQVPMGRKWALQMAVVPVPDAPQQPMGLISGDGELWMEQRTAAYTAHLERAEEDAATQQDGEGTIAAALAAAASLSTATRASVESNALRGRPSVVKELLVDPLRPDSSQQGAEISES